MRHIKAVVVGAAAALILGTGCRSERQEEFRGAQQMQGTGGSSMDSSGERSTPSEDSMRGFQGQDSDVHGTGGAGFDDTNARPMAPPQSDMRSGSGGTGDLDQGQQGDLRTGSMNELGTGGSKIIMPHDLEPKDSATGGSGSVDRSGTDADLITPLTPQSRDTTTLPDDSASRSNDIERR